MGYALLSGILVTCALIGYIDYIRPDGRAKSAAVPNTLLVLSLLAIIPAILNL